MEANQQGWQPMDTVPLDGTSIDLWDRGGYRWTNVRWDYIHWLYGRPKGDKGWTGGNINYMEGPGPDPVAWMHIPKAPAFI